MIISYGWTAQYLPPFGTKDTTRRLWKPRTLESWQRSFDTDPTRRHTAVDKCLAYGGKRIGTIVLTSRPYLENLADMPTEDLTREGGMCKTIEEFIDRYFDGNRDQEVAVVRFSFQPLN
jgi:hypothetical protein